MTIAVAVVVVAVVEWIAMVALTKTEVLLHRRHLRRQGVVAMVEATTVVGLGVVVAFEVDMLEHWTGKVVGALDLGVYVPCE